MARESWHALRKTIHNFIVKSINQINFFSVRAQKLLLLLFKLKI